MSYIIENLRRSPVCVRMCLLRCSLLKNRFGHISHGCLRSSVWIPEKLKEPKITFFFISEGKTDSTYFYAFPTTILL